MQRIKRNLFTKEEDEKIKEIVRNIGEDWSVISKHLHGRTPKQCHDRYMNYLREGLTTNPWAQSEDDLLMKLYAEIGPKWSTMLKQLPGRSGNDIKNRWHKHLVKSYPRQISNEVLPPSITKYQSANFNQSESSIPKKMPVPQLCMLSFLPRSTYSTDTQNVIHPILSCSLCSQVQQSEDNSCQHHMLAKVSASFCEPQIDRARPKIDNSQVNTDGSHTCLENSTSSGRSSNVHSNILKEKSDNKTNSNHLNLYSPVSLTDIELREYFHDISCFDAIFNESNNSYLDF